MDNRSILIVDDEKITAFYLRDLLTAAGYDVYLAEDGDQALEILATHKFSLAITDMVTPGDNEFLLIGKIKRRYPDLPIFILTSHGSYDVARKAQAMGADDYLLKPINPDQLRAAVAKALEKSYYKNQSASGLHFGEAHFAAYNIVGASEAMGDVFRLIEKARHSKGHVLIRGESGTGKELVARAICDSESNGNGHFVIVNCCAISEGLIESELFGHSRGAFSGAVADREGLFEIADGGTVFLDEIGDIPLRSQTKLLRLLQEGEYRRVGENKLRHVNVRIVAATNRNLEEAIQQGHFREDLYYRLNVIPIPLPPLRARLSDIPLLVKHFLSKHQPIAGANLTDPAHPAAFAGNGRSTAKIGMAEDAVELLARYSFPGNIRELENIMQRAISLAKSRQITKTEIEGYLAGSAPQALQPLLAPASEERTYPTLKSRLHAIEREFVLARLMEFNWSVSHAAKKMEITRTALHNRMKKLGINSKEFRKTGAERSKSRG